MGDCRYCHIKAGLFKDAHEDCTKEAERARKALQVMIIDEVTLGNHSEKLPSLIQELRSKGRLTDEETRSVLLQAADDATFEIAMKSPMDYETSERISDLFKFIDPDWFSDVNKIIQWRGYLSLLHSSNLWEVLHGRVPYSPPGMFKEYRFLNNEHPILKRNAVLAEYRSVPSGRSYQGASVPIGGGMYYRIGTSQPRTPQTGLVRIDEGLMALTTQAIYFTSHKANFRLPYTSIIRIESFVDGFGVYENHGSGKVFIPSLLQTMDEGWYFYNLVSALMNWREAAKTHS